jgi:hypothetical protein
LSSKPKKGIAVTIALALAGIAVAVGLGLITAQLTTPSVGINDEPPSISEELVEPPPSAPQRGRRLHDRHERRDRLESPELEASAIDDDD